MKNLNRGEKMIKKGILLCILCVLLVCLCSCSDDTVNTLLGTASNDFSKEEKIEISDAKLRDKPALYYDYGQNEIVTMYLTVMTGNEGENTNHTWEEINTYSAYDYDRMGVDRYKVEGLLQVGDENGAVAGELGYDQVSPNCTVQIRGQSSSRNAQKNYKISIKDNKGQWRGQSTIALNKHQTDGLRFRNKLSYDLIAGIDEMMGLRTTFVHLYVKDTTKGNNAKFEDYGIYTQVEQLNKTALRTHGLDRNGHLYKINYFEFYRYEDIIMLKDDPDYDVKAFEELIEIKGSDDHAKLISLLDKINDYSIPIDDILQEHFDIENVTYWMAFHILMGNVDTQSRNVYFYSPLNSEKWYFLSWDNDGSLKKMEHEIQQRNDYTEWETGISNYWGNVFFNRCLKSSAYREKLDAAIEDLKVYLSPERINTLANSYASLIKPYIYSMPDIMHAPLTSSQYDVVLNSLSSEIDKNYNLYYESYKHPMPFYIGTPQKNGDKMMVVWDASYDFNAETITYSFELANDVNFNNILYKQENILVPEAQFDKLPKGQYFIRVKAKNQSGYTQTAFDSYLLSDGKVYGTICFYIDEKGNVVREEYVD